MPALDNAHAMTMVHAHDFLSMTGKRWLDPGTQEIQDLNENMGLPEWGKALLARRGFVTDAAIKNYLTPSLRMLDAPNSIQDITRGADRICQASTRGERIVVYGDYDVDGVCSTAIVVECLRQFGMQVSYYIPDRRAEGYGLNMQAVRELMDQHDLMITVDCGITAVEEVAFAQDGGLDVIIVDHHQVPSPLPRAVACINPQRQDCHYPFKGLCAAGVAFMLMGVVRQQMRQHNPEMIQPDLRELLDLVAVATVADMVPLSSSNRILVSCGLQRMRHSMRLGLTALCRIAKVDPQRLNASDLGFRLGPRINARGRMSQASLAVDLMLCQDPTQADAMAMELDQANLSRRQLEQQTVEEALQQVETDNRVTDSLLVVSDPQWHPGILGLVASRLVGKYHRPVVVIGQQGKGSARSISGFNIYEALCQTQTHLQQFGGHPAAAGLTIAQHSIDAFRRDLSTYARTHLGAPPYTPNIQLDLEIHADWIDDDFMGFLEHLGPFGQANPEPILCVRNLEVYDKRCVGEKHLKLQLGDLKLSAIGFGLGHLRESIPTHIDALFHLEYNHFRGQRSLQMRLIDIAASTNP